MPMILSRPGQNNLAGDPKVIFLRQYAGEVLVAFREKNIMASRTMNRTIQNGKSATFPASWKATAEYHTPGTELDGQAFAVSEREIFIDDVLISDHFIAEIDELMNHWDYRQEISAQQGQALARTYDRNLQQCVLLAARASSTVVGGNGGTRIVNANAGTDVDVFLAALTDAAQAFAEKEIPDGDRYCAVKPELYYKLVNSGTLNSAEVIGANANIRSGTVHEFMGFEIVQTNNLPTTNVTTGPVPYRGDFSNTVAAVWHRSAVGTVKLMDIRTETEWLIKVQGNLLLAKYAVGHGILRPESALEIATA